MTTERLEAVISPYPCLVFYHCRRIQSLGASMRCGEHGLSLSCFSHSFDKTPALRRRDDFSPLLVEGAVLHDREGTASSAGGGWSRHMQSGIRQHACWPSAQLSPLYQVWYSNLWNESTQMVSLLGSVNPFWKHSHRLTRWCVPMVILSPIKIITDLKCVAGGSLVPPGPATDSAPNKHTKLLLIIKLLTSSQGF